MKTVATLTAVCLCSACLCLAAELGDPAPPLQIQEWVKGEPVTIEPGMSNIVVVEFWATWCAPCKTTVPWLGGLQRAYADDLAVVAVAVGSEEPAARAFVGPDLVSRLRVAMATPDLVARFGDLSAVPTLFVFDRDGRTAGVFYGAPPDLHEKVERLVERLAR